jgi:prevent-host-death family protein
MFKLSHNIDSLSNFKRKTTTFLKRMKKTGEPVILTINGKAELVVQDAASFDRFLRFTELQDSLEVLRKSLEDVEAGRTRPMRQAIEGLGKRK